ncbi:MAG: hypothetical protein JO123_04745, partial [Ktedonobacteraceae bacterium]|nr:hypothetical protein [Ktedonobacteraceae bacterium]
MGEITECVVLAKLIEFGYKCLIPWGHDQRYDIAIRRYAQRFDAAALATNEEQSTKGCEVG